VASPYRRHLFERIAATFHQARFFFTVHDGDAWLKYQAWNASVLHWNVRSHNLRLKVPLPHLTFIHLDYILWLLFQPRGTIHLVGCVHGNYFLILLFCLLRKSSFVLWNDAGFPDRLSDRPPSLAKRFLLRHVKAAFTSGRMGRAFYQKFGVPDAAIYNAYFSHDVEAFKRFYTSSAVSSREAIRASIGAKDNEFVVLCIARLLDWKRVEDLAEALLLIDCEQIDLAKKLHFVLIGDGEYRRYETVVANFKNVTFRHEKRIEYEEIKSWFCAADVFGFPSEGDIWGLVVNEALSLGLPVICTDRIGSAELVRDGWNGFVIKPRSPRQMAEKIMNLASQPKLLADMRKNALTIWNTWNSELGLAELERLVRTVSAPEAKG
jgi:glycosyltransferase involved in cell wall biosynthesis